MAKAQPPASVVDYRSHDQHSDNDCSNKKTEPSINLLTRPVAPLLAYKPLVKLMAGQQPLATRTEKQNSRA